VVRIAITGIGSVNALGAGVQTFADGLRQGRCAIGPLSLFPELAFRSRCAAEVRDLRLPESVPRRVARRASRSTRLALIAAAEAWQGAGLEAADEHGTGIVIGTTTGGIGRGEEGYRRMLQGDEPPLSAWLETPVVTPAEALAQTFGCSGPHSGGPHSGGPRLTVSTACSSGANALGIAADWIRQGRASTVLCGGVDCLCLMTYSGFDSLQALDPEPCKPFDAQRAGLSLGEGAAMFVLEDFEHARRRGAPVLAELVGYGVSADAHHLTQPRPDGAGAALAMRRALQEGGVAPEEIDYVNAHGTGTPLNDVAETVAIKSVFGAHAYRMPISSTKSMIGHCLAAAGAIEALASLIAIRDQFVPPTATLQHADPQCDLDYVARTSRPVQLRTVVSNAYGFGGNNTSLVLRAADD
jgi:3-oxoacyl-[acyl-carrier-protein] synthase II